MASALEYLRAKTKRNKAKMRKGGPSAAKYAAKYQTYKAMKRKAPGYAPKRKRSRATASVTSAPVTMGVSVTGGLQSSFTQRQLSGGGLRITGRSFITSINSTNKYTNGLLAVNDCNPILLNDRVAAIATTYEKYVYQSITYRYVPQCATSTAGSVMLTFERDPANPAANGGDDTTFMQNCMSYEHTSITPPWVGSSVTYKRDANEKKLFYISGQGSNYDPRLTSQGQFLCYGANVPTGTGLGFIVMDYVLDLCEPSIMPARTGAGLGGASATNIPRQWQFSNVNAITKADAAGASSVMNNFIDLSGGELTAANGNCVLEVILEGTTVPNAGNTLWAASEVNAKSVAIPAPSITLSRGSHLYIVLRRAKPFAAATYPDLAASSATYAVLTRNLADAIAALSTPSDQVVTTGTFAFGNALYPLQASALNTALNVSGFWRQLTLKSTDDFQV